MAIVNIIDLHSHILPGVDDGADSIDTALAMARIAVEGGTEVMACTPHIYPGLYMNDALKIKRERDTFQKILDSCGISLQLVIGCDAHMVPELLDGLNVGRIPTLAGSRYFLLEPAHHVAPPGFEQFVVNILAAGYVPIITHPERLTWIEDHNASIVELAHKGCWLQLTAGSLTGIFGKRAKYWSERLLDEGLVHLIASDAHDTVRRSPNMAPVVQILEHRVGLDEAKMLLTGRPQSVLDDISPHLVPSPPGIKDAVEDKRIQRQTSPYALKRLLFRVSGCFSKQKNK